MGEPSYWDETVLLAQASVCRAPIADVPCQKCEPCRRTFEEMEYAAAEADRELAETYALIGEGRP